MKKFNTLDELFNYSILATDLVCFLKSINCETKCGHYVFKNKNFVNIFEYETDKLTDEVEFECHDKYADIHICLAGEEKVELSTKESCSKIGEYNIVDDNQCFRGRPSYEAELKCFEPLLIDAGEPHQTGYSLHGKTRVKKAVVKLLKNF